MSSTFSLQSRRIAEGKLTAQPLNATPEFNWIFLVELIVCGVLVLFFLFYFNRLFATIVSYGIRAYTWRYYRIYVDIHALQISLLAGRIFFKGFRYHGENETILIQTGYLTWRYWLRSVRAAGIYCENEDMTDHVQESGDRSGKTEKRGSLPCRIELSVQGLEWFVYNRSAAYQTVLEGFPCFENLDTSQTETGNGKDETVSTNGTPPSARVNMQRDDNVENKAPAIFSENSISQGKEFSVAESAAKVLARVLTRSSSPPESMCLAEDTSKTATPKFFALLPLWLQCNKGAIVFGNENTKSILTAKFDKANGQVDVRKAGPYDSHKQVFDFDFSHPIIQLKPNPDFKQSQLAAARAADSAHEASQHHGRRGLHWRYQRQKRRMWHRIRDLIPYFQRSVESFHPNLENRSDRRSGSRTFSGLLRETRWIGLTRYLDEEDQDEHEGWNAVEYGRSSTILDCPSLLVSYYWDAPGRVPTEQDSPGSSILRVFHDINGAEPPEWGLDMTLRGGSINYGPWADRERACFQSIFFPNAHRNSRPVALLAPGQFRQSTKFKMRILFEEDVTFRIPTREPSKDWLWKGRVDAVKGSAKLKKQNDRSHPRDSEPDKSTHGPDIRPFGWFLLQIDAKSTAKYDMDIVASSEEGYQSRLDIFLHGSKMTSSINHGLLWKSGKQTISCDLPNPLEWNSLRTWNFDIKSQGIDFFLLRDHIFLLTDMVNDWTSGPYPDYHTFVPFKYNLNFSLESFRLYLNVNESNIINNPSDTDDNAFLVVKGDLQADVCIPMTRYKPSYNSVTFDINLVKGLIQLLTPLWNTQRTFIKDQSVGSLKSLRANGTYTYNLATSPTLTDVLTMDIVGDSPQLRLYGFLIRYFLNIKENYFGEFLHFKTLEEFQKLSGTEEPSATRSGTNPNRKTNDLDIILHIRGEKPTVFLPAGIYSSKDALSVRGAFLETDIRFTNYYMDIEISFSPLELATEQLHPLHPGTFHDASTPQICIDGLRIYGHRLFGLPPTEPTYVCNWDFDVGKIMGECTSAFLKCAASALRYVGFSIDDEENALPPLQSVSLHDVTFLRASVHSINIWTLVDNAAFLIKSSQLRFDFNDLAGETFSDRLNLKVSDLIFAVVDQNSALHHREIVKPAKTHAYFQTSLKVTMMERKYDFMACRSLQQQHIKVHDQRSNRTPWLLRVSEQNTPSAEHQARTRVSPPAMPVPFMPEPASRTYFEDMPSSDSLSWTSGRVGAPNYNIRAGAAPYQLSACPSSRWLERKDPETEKEKHSSGWSRVPHFRFRNVHLDTSLVPLLPPINASVRRPQTGNIETRLRSEDESAKASQVYVLCDLNAGLKGYCSPEAIYAFSSLVGELQASHPIEIIDNLQASVISDILSHEKRMSKPRQIVNLSLRFPVCRVKLVHDFRISETKFQDEYNIDIGQVQVLFRQRAETKRENVSPILSGATVHAAINSISFFVKGEELDALGQRCYFHTKLGDLSFWSASQGVTQSRLQLQTFEAITSNDSVEGLALLAGRTSKLIDSMIDLFTQISTNQKTRLQSLIFALTKSGSQISDPLFLTRPSYVLRSAGEQLRLHDSWKIISRFRNIYNSLPNDQKTAITTACIDGTLTCPPDARSFVLSNFDRWRTWDLAHVKKSYAMKLIWGEPYHAGQESDNWVPGFHFASVGTIRFSVDPGPKESDLLIQDLSVCIDRRGRPCQGTSLASSIGPCVSVQTYCSDTTLRLKWEICQLVEGVLRTFFSRTPQPSTTQRKPDDRNFQSKTSDLQFIFISDRGKIELDSINLKLNLAGEGLEGSIIHHDPGASASTASSVLIAADSSFMEFRSRSKALMFWHLLRPNIFLSHSSEHDGSRTTHDWKCSAACESLRYDMMEDPLGLMHVADRIVEDEIKYLFDVTVPLGPPEPQDISSDSKAIHRLSVATFLNDYDLRISLLPSITHSISGEVARLSIAPTLQSNIEIDFDIKNNVHTLRSDNDGKERVISSLTVPPINGRVRVNYVCGQTSLDIDSTIEVIKVEAGAVRNLLATISGPEISHFVSDLSHDARILKQRLTQVTSRRPHSPIAEKPKEQNELLYKLRLTLAGINIHASAPGLRNKDYSADLSFKFGLIQIHVENSPEAGVILEHPEFHVNFSQGRFELLKREKREVQPYGSLALYARISGVSRTNGNGESIRSYHLSSDGLAIELFAETASMIIDIVAHLQKRLKSIDLSHEVKHLRKLRLIGSPEKKRDPSIPLIEEANQLECKKLFDAMYSVELRNFRLIWLISAPNEAYPGEAEDLMFSIKKVELATKKDNAARLRIEAMQLQMVPTFEDKNKRSQNSALLPEAVFNVAYLSTSDERRFAFQAAGKAVDIRITSDFIVPASMLQSSLASASEKLREANDLWIRIASPDQKKKVANPNVKRLGSLLIDADFAGAVVCLQSRQNNKGQSDGLLPDSGWKYGQYIQNSAVTARFQAPGVALKVQFEDTGIQDPTLNAELKVDASTNVVYPTVVPLITQISSSVKEVVGDGENGKAVDKQKGVPEITSKERAIGANNPTTILGKCKLNIGLRICKQEFTLSCQPIARVAATARFGDSYITVNTVQSEEKRRFFAMQIAFNSLQASIKHVYSSESTASLELESVVMSLMNSKHVSTSAGISAILKISPIRLYGNVKQAQDFLLFREIWIPQDETPSPPRAPDLSSPETQAYLVQRYRQMAAAGAFPWNSALAIEQLYIQLDLGQTVGRADFTIQNLWVSSKKNSDWEQNLCIGCESIEIQSKGRLSGHVQFSRVKLRTSIVWTDEMATDPQTPLIQASVGFAQLQAKVSFEYQPFLLADVASFEFLMYNVRDPAHGKNDRLVSTLEGDKLQVFCTTLTASQSVALYQTVQKLMQDKQAAFDSSLKEVESFLRRKSTALADGARPESLKSKRKDQPNDHNDDNASRMPISLHTNVMVSLRTINIGAFPSTFDDSQVFKLEARDVEVRFSAAAFDEKIHGGLGLTLGGLRVGLSSVNRPSELATEDLSVNDIAHRVADSRGGTILKVPRVVVTMETWQSPMSSHIDYVFKSSFEGRVDVGWNYSRISFIRGMWTNHSRALASRLGKPLPLAAVRITGGPKKGEDGEYTGQEKITAVVNVPQSRYNYTALEPPVIETPQLRDMGEATPPLEWIGLHRDKLPNLTHQIIMVTLMEVAKDVEDAYSKILGS
ncbi:hypothetical protein VTO42DRAFT_1883 [Malbranchea cinnamomea]